MDVRIFRIVISCGSIIYGVVNRSYELGLLDFFKSAGAKLQKYRKRQYRDDSDEI
ncbi:hypothetical protein ACN6MY_21230 [Peribacillus sp. B-H-3]|jgi:hypothetical protein|uniref:hypothetical protein n=1 Tax=Peribacillus sp. B-H-3 TaxID=3400420 RepID=UPI003B026C94